MSTIPATEPEIDVRVARARETFVRNLRVIMAREGLKVRPLADRLARPYGYVWHRVTGRTVPNLDDLAAFAAALDVPVSELVSDDEPTTTYIPGGES